MIRIKAIVILAAFFSLIATLTFAAQDEKALTYRDIDELIEAGNLDKAEGILNGRYIKDRSDYIAMTGLGRIYIEKGDRKRALKFLKSAVKINPDYPMAHFFLGRLHFLMQEPEDAASEFGTFREKMGPEGAMDDATKEVYISRLHYICEAYFTLKKYDLYRNEIDEILRLDPQNQTAFYNLGVYYYIHQHSRSKAYELFKKAMDLDPATYIGRKARYAIEYIRANPDSRVIPDFSFIDKQ